MCRNSNTANRKITPRICVWYRTKNYYILVQKYTECENISEIELQKGIYLCQLTFRISADDGICKIITEDDNYKVSSDEDDISVSVFHKTRYIVTFCNVMVVWNWRDCVANSLLTKKNWQILLKTKDSVLLSRSVNELIS